MGYGAAIGGVISGIGSLIGGKGSKSDGFSQKGSWQQANFALKSAPHYAQALRRYAKAAGIHRLALVGKQPYGQSLGVAGSETGSDLSGLADIGQAVGGAVDSYLNRNERAKVKAEQEEMRKLKLEEQRYINDGLLQQNMERATRNTVGEGPGLGNQDGPVQYNPSQLVREHPSVRGQEAGYGAGTAATVDRHGMVHETPSERLKNLTEENPLAMGRIITADVGRAAKYNHWTRTVSGRNKLRAVRDRLQREMNLPRHQHLRWHQGLGQWRVTNNSEGKYLFGRTPYGRETIPERWDNW